MISWIIGLPLKANQTCLSNSLLKQSFFLRLLKNAQMLGPRSAFHLPIRQAIPRSEAYLEVRRNDEGPAVGRGNDADGRFSATC